MNVTRAPCLAAPETEHGLFFLGRGGPGSEEGGAAGRGLALPAHHLLHDPLQGGGQPLAHPPQVLQARHQVRRDRHLAISLMAWVPTCLETSMAMLRMLPAALMALARVSWSAE